MRAAGVKITEEPGPDGHMAFIEDPDGYEIELLEYDPGEYEAMMHKADEAAGVR
jgi:hypothetical protein